jgi:hypothetical protein
MIVFALELFVQTPNEMRYNTGVELQELYRSKSRICSESTLAYNFSNINITPSNMQKKRSREWQAEQPFV